MRASNWIDVPIEAKITVGGGSSTAITFKLDLMDWLVGWLMGLDWMNWIPGWGEVKNRHSSAVLMKLVKSRLSQFKKELVGEADYAAGLG